MVGPTLSMNASSGEVTETGWIARDGYQFLSAEGDGVRTHTGTYSSWECAKGVSGGYRAVGEMTVTKADGTEEKAKPFCEARRSTGGRARLRESRGLSVTMDQGEPANPPLHPCLRRSASCTRGAAASGGASRRGQAGSARAWGQPAAALLGSPPPRTRKQAPAAGFCCVNAQCSQD